MMLDDPVAAAAPLARRLARDHCRIDPQTGESCAWYHGARLYIRALGIGQCSIPQSHHDFFARALADLAADRNFSSILVSGSADYAMPRLIIEAFDRVGRMPALSVVDICETPLRLIGWYAARHDLAIALQHSDIIDHEAESAADVLCTHHLFNYFAAQDRPRVVAKWHALLRPGGKLVVVSRYRSAAGPSGASARAGREAFTAAMVAAARAQAPSLGVASEELVEMIHTYRAQIRAQCLDSAEELRRLLELSGFAIERYDVLAQRRGATAGGLTRQESADAVGVIARRL